MKKQAKMCPRETPVKNPRVISREIEGQTVLLNLESGEYFVLNSTAAVIWNAVGSKSYERIVGRVAEDYKIGKPAADEAVGQFVDQLLHEGLLCERAAE